MKGLQRAGDYIREFLAVTVIVAVAAATVLPFFPVTVGLAAFFRQDIDRRRLRDIFKAIGENAKITAAYTAFELVVLAFSLLNIYFFQTHPENLNGFVLGVSYIALAVGVFGAISLPVIIANMNVTFLQAVRNGFMLLCGGPLRTALAVAAPAGVIALILFFPYVVPLTFYPLFYLVNALMGENFYRLKAKALHTTVEALRRESEKDDYLDEYGNIRRSAKAAEDGEKKDDEKRN